MEEKYSWPGWETVRLIGRGSFGGVYEIRRDVFGHEEKAAMKVITIPQNDSDAEELFDSGYDEQSVTETFRSHLESIVNEYTLMRQMNGAANVVNCDDFRIVEHVGKIGWDIFIKMELLTPLTRAVGREPSEEQVRRIAHDLCSALVLCKKYGIIHRDIKPQNIFVSQNGDYKLGDFGIAKTVEKTSGGTKIGTYKYMAPEVYNNQPYNLTADIYSLGLVLHWLLNERRSPFMPLPPTPATAALEDEARARRFAGEPIPAPAHGSEALKRIVLKACAYDPKDRYQSADEMLRDVEALSAPSPVAPAPEPEDAPTELPTAQPAEEATVSSPAPKSETLFRAKPAAQPDAPEAEPNRNYPTPEDRTVTVQTPPPAPAQGAAAAPAPAPSPAPIGNPAPAPQKKKARWPLFAVLAAVLALIVGTVFLLNRPAPAPTATPEPTAATEPTVEPTPKATPEPFSVSESLTMGTGGEAGTYYAFGTVLGSYISQNTGLSVEVVASNGDASNIDGIIHDGIYDLGIVQSNTLAYVYYGLDSPPADYQWTNGIRVLGGLYALPVQIITCNPEIQSVSDLISRNVCLGEKGSITFNQVLELLDAYGLSLDDITPVYQSFGEAVDGLRDGRIDAAVITSGIPTIPVVDLAISTDIHLVSIDAEHMEKLLSDSPWYSSYVIPAGTYSGMNEDTVTFAAKVLLVCRADLSDDAAYAIVSTIYNNTEAIGALHAKGYELSLASAVEGVAVPFHDGAAKYFAENGILVPTG